MTKTKANFFLRFIFATTLVLFSTHSFAMPSDLLYDGKPIDPLCIQEFYYPDKVAYLKTCGLHAEEDRSITLINKKLSAQGYTGFNYSWLFDKNMPPSTGYSYYKWVGDVAGSHILYSLNNTGGSGNFSSLKLVKREGNSNLAIHSLMEGDRCNGGIWDVRMHNQKLSYRVDMTPFDFLEISKDNPHQLKAHQHLDACAACCVASAKFERKLTHDFETQTLVSVDLNSYLPRTSGNTYQVCFDKLVSEYKHKDKHHLSAAEFEMFTHDFNSRCVV